MVRTLSSLYLFVIVGCLLETNAQSWLCPTAGSCAKSLGEEFNETSAQIDDSYVIEFCLKKKDFQTSCLNNAVVDCEWAGDEEEYYRLRNVQRNTQGKCSELCPAMEELQLCPSHVSTPLFSERKFHQFCNSYKASLNCKNSALSGGTKCTFGERLFLRGFDEDTVRVFTYICSSECADIDTAWAVLERCTTTHNLNRAGSQCKIYQDLEICLSTSNACPQIHMMAPYFARNYTEYTMKCPLPMPVVITTTDSELETEKIDDALTDDKATIKSSDDTTLSKLEVNSKPNQDPIEETKEMVTKESSTTTVKVRDSGTISTLNACLSTLQSLEAMSITSGAYCDSVHCLIGQGFRSNDVSLLGLEEVLRQNLLNRWNSCANDDITDIQTKTTDELAPVVIEVTTDNPALGVKDMTTNRRENQPKDLTNSVTTTDNPDPVTTTMIKKTTSITTPFDAELTLKTSITDNRALFKADKPTGSTPTVHTAVKTQTLAISRDVSKLTVIINDKTSFSSAFKTRTKYAPTRGTMAPTVSHSKPVPRTFSKTESTDMYVKRLFDGENKEFVVIDNRKTEHSPSDDYNDRHLSKAPSFISTSLEPLGSPSISSVTSNSAVTSNSIDEDIEPPSPKAGADTYSSNNLKNGTSRQTRSFLLIYMLLTCVTTFLYYM